MQTADFASTNFYFLNLFSALVNKGNCLFVSGDYEKAREYYQEAYNVEASCTEALFNLGMPTTHICYESFFLLLSCTFRILPFRTIVIVWLYSDRYMSVYTN